MLASFGMVLGAGYYALWLYRRVVFGTILPRTDLKNILDLDKPRKARDFRTAGNPNRIVDGRFIRPA